MALPLRTYHRAQSLGEGTYGWVYIICDHIICSFFFATEVILTLIHAPSPMICYRTLQRCILIYSSLISIFYIGVSCVFIMMPVSRCKLYHNITLYFLRPTSWYLPLGDELALKVFEADGEYETLELGTMREISILRILRGILWNCMFFVLVVVLSHYYFR